MKPSENDETTMMNHSSSDTSDSDIESERKTLVIFRPQEDDACSCESDDITLVSSSGSESEATPPQPTVQSAGGTLINVKPYEGSCSSSDSHKLLIASAVDDVLTCVRQA
ncbi:hypothetical protein DPEC_G00122810 [Dallia pectoralis]|uniref:Uncharacterized protein n=1 Tax=Dallia pectoralis TaxID=75939 RepID=A0ACC2GQG7_DALPE|nr:hypothetical protein DPEC_G00122810 [Dallia pectoralis]